MRIFAPYGSIRKADLGTRGVFMQRCFFNVHIGSDVIGDETVLEFPFLEAVQFTQQ
jgi:hypothetical protein